MPAFSFQKLSAYLAATSSLAVFSLNAATFLVDRTADDTLPGSLRTAIINANASPGSTIIFDPSLTGGTITLTGAGDGSSFPRISTNMTINGSGAPNLSINGGNSFRPFTIAGTEAITVNISNLRIFNCRSLGAAGGSGPTGGGGGGGAAGAGGGVFVNNTAATVNLTNLNFVQNNATGGTGGNNTSVMVDMGGTHAGGGGGGGGGGNGGGVGGAGATTDGGTNQGGGGGGGGGSEPGAPASTAGQPASGNVGGNGGASGGGVAGGNGGGPAGNAPGGGGGGGGGAFNNIGLFGGNVSINMMTTLKTGGGGGGSLTDISGAGGGGGGSAGVLSANSNQGGAGGAGAAFGAGGGGGAGRNTGGAGGNGGYGCGSGGGGGNVGGVSPAAAAGIAGTLGGTGGLGQSGGGGGGGGGGGAGLGGAVAFFPSSNVTLTDCTFNSGAANTASAGGAGSGAAGGVTNGTAGSIRGQDIFVATGSTTTFNVSSAMTIPSALEGDGSTTSQVVKTGAGVLTLSTTSVNVYQGPTTINQGTVSIGAAAGISPNTIFFNGGALRATAAFVLPNTLDLLGGGGTLDVAVAGTLTASGVITGSGSLTKVGTGTLFPSNNNTYTGVTNFNEGAILITAPAQLGPNDFNFSGGTLSTSFSMPGTMQRTLQQNINLITSGRFNISGANGLILTGDITGTGSLTKDNAGSLIFQNSGGNTYSGATTIIDGEIQANLPNTFSPNSAVNLIITGILDLNNFNQTIASLSSVSGASQVQLGSGNLTTGDSSNTSFAGVISGTGSLIKQGSGTFTLTNTNTYSGGTQFNGGVLAVTAAAQLGSAASPLTFNGGTLQTTGTFSLAKNVTMTGAGTFDTVSGTLTLSNPVTGAGTLNKIGTGTLVFSGANTNTGLTNIVAGTAQAGANNALSSAGSFNVGAAGILDLSLTTMQSIGSLSGDVGASVLLGAAALTTGSDNTNTSFSGDISGTGSLIKTGTGIFILSNGSTYTGGTQVQQGTLNIPAGTLPGPMTVALGGKLSGNFTLTNAMTDLINNGNVSPGNSIGTINVLGNYIQGAGGTLSIEIDPAGNTSLLNVSGNSTLAGAVAFTPQAGVYLDGTNYTFLTTASTMNTTFDSFSFTSPIGLSSRLFYDPGLTFVQLQLFIGANPFVVSTFSGNAAKVAEFTDCALTSDNADFDIVVSNILSLPHSQQQMAFETITPAILGGLSLAEESNAIAMRTAVSHRTFLLHSIDCPIEDSQKVGVSLWLDGYEQWIDQDSWSQQTGFDAKNRGLILGLDYQVLQDLYVGAAGSYAHSHISWDDSAGHGNISSYYGGLYATWIQDLFYIDAAIFGASNSYDETRYLDFADIHRRAKSDHHGYEVEANLGAGLTFQPWGHSCTNRNWENSDSRPSSCSNDLGLMMMIPFFNLDYVYLHENSFREKGADSLNLTVSKKNSNLLRSEVGLKISYCGVFNAGRVIPEVKLSYVRESRFNDKNYHSFFTDIGNTLCGRFSTNTNPPNRNLFNPEVGLNIIVLKDSLDISAYYEANVGKNYLQQEGRLHFEYRF